MHVVATAGHVDHGKSTLLRTLTGMEPDRWEEERVRGLTIDLGFVWTELATTDGERLQVAFVDVPGHERFIANMLAGAGAVSLCLFVVAADDGWSAQSQEHLDILDLLGVEAAVVAVTKSDLAGPDRTLEVAADVEERIAATTLVGAPVVLTDAVTGTGMAELRATLAARLATTPPPPDRDRPRLWIDRSFTIGGAGTVVTGTLAGGQLRTDDEPLLLPAGRTARIRGLQSLGRPVELAAPPARLAVNLAGVDRGTVRRGDALTARADWIVTTTLDAWARALPGHRIERRGAWHLHVGAAEVTCRVVPVLDAPIEAGEPGYVRLLLDAPLPLQYGDRFVLRDAGRRATVGGGEVVDPQPAGRLHGTEQRLERAERLAAIREAASPQRRVAALVVASGGARPRSATLAAAGLPNGADPGAGLVVIGDRLVEPGRLDTWTVAVRERARRHRSEHPDASGAPRTALSDAAAAVGAPREVAAALPDHLAGTGALRRVGAAYAVPEDAPAVDQARAERRAAFLRLLQQQPLAPPPLSEAARTAGLPYPEVQALLQTGEIVRCGDLAFTREAVDHAIAVLRVRFGQARFTASEAKEAWGTTRRFAIPLLEHLDVAGVTDFDGQQRVLAPGR